MKKILVIEDDNSVREGIIELLLNSGYNVFSAKDGVEGVSLAREIIPDLIICDIMMPGLNGYEVLEQLTKKGKKILIPFIYLTAKADMTDLRKGMELGADDYIIKPFESKTILNAITTRLMKKENEIKLLKKKEDIKPFSIDKKLSLEDRIFVDSLNKMEFLKVKDLVFINSAGNYCKLITLNKKTELLRKTLNELQNLLPEDIFLRIHRSVIINLNYVEKISKWTSGTYKVFIKDFNEPFTLSQRYAQKIKYKLKL